MNPDIVLSNRFRRDLKSARKRGYDLESAVDNIGIHVLVFSFMDVWQQIRQ